MYNFAAGDPIVPSHPKILEEVQKRMAIEPILYPPIAGISELRSLAAEWMNADYGCTYKEENTLVTAGGKFALFAAMQLF